MKKQGRKAIDEAVVAEESRRLNDIWQKTEKSVRGTQAEFGEKHAIGSQGMVWQLLHGESPLSLQAAKNFAKGLGCQISDFSPRLADLASAWPFELVDQELYESLSLAQQHKAQYRMQDEIEDIVRKRENLANGTSK